ncbi:MAG: biotin synthase BioB [Lachnospiraceae bacterium]|nr:biotin synthase BioB [Lachnospiraceae bacterium]MBQ9607685.1 biotin synthase BioB [Lachnospiraceae bacterium]
MDVLKLADEIIAGRRLGAEDDLYSLVEADIDELKQGADRIREALCGDKVDLCTIISGRSGRCSEDCKFCAQSAFHKTSCDVYGLLSSDEIFNQAKANEAEGVDRFSIVDSGFGPSAEDFEKIIEIFERMRDNLNIELCCSLGFMTSEQFHRLHLAGVTGVHCNIETSKRFFPKICTTHKFEDKIANIRRAQAEGMAVCSGGIIGMGEDWNDRIDMALTLKDLGVESIPINSLMPISGTALEGRPRLTEDEILRTVAIFRYINPTADIRLAGGRALMTESGRDAFNSGASASITGNMLTTSGSTIKSDKAMLEEMGRDTTPDWTRPEEERWDRRYRIDGK